MPQTEKSVFPTTSDNSEKKLRAHFETLGCRLNQIESEGAAEFFFKAGFEISMNPVSAKDAVNDEVCVCVLNTCAVTTKAEQKARRTIRLLLQKFPNAVLIVTGCYAQLSKDEIAAMDERIFVLPGLAKKTLADIPKAFSSLAGRSGREKGKGCFVESVREVLGVEAVGDVAMEPFKLLPETFFSHSRASLKIQDGCNNNCSYCAIHFARGKSVSIAPLLAVERAKALEEAGHNEVVLTGVNIGQYCGEYEGMGIGVAELLELILQNTKNIAVRFSSIYPETVTEKFCEVIQSPRVRPHFHLSVQSGSDSILKRMNRRYTRETVLVACSRLKEAKQNPFLACDIITGFPGETDADFLQTMDLVKECGFVNVHAFPFSPRKGTAAFSYTPKIPERVKDERVKALNEFSAWQKIQYINSFVETIRPAISESVHSTSRTQKSVVCGKKLLHAVTDNFIHVEIFTDENFPAPKEGECVQVKIIGAQEEKIRAGDEWEAIGEIVG